MNNIRKVYADNNATTPVHPDVVKKMLPYFETHFGNASSLHSWGREARKAVEDSRLKIAESIGSKSEEIYFTSCGTEADNWAIKGIVDASENKNAHMITTSIEHPAVLNVVKYLEKKGYKATYLPVDGKGYLKIEELKKFITDDTVLISVMLANNETGAIQPIKEIGDYLKELNVERKANGKNKIFFHTDAVQGLGKIHFNVNDLGVDLASISSHKINGPKGVGALFIRKGTKITPLLHGGHHEGHKRAGTENVAGIVGFGEACNIALGHIDEESEKLKKLKLMLFKGVKEKIDEVYLNGDLENSLPNTLNISFNFVEGESVILNLDLKGIGVSSGSACTSGALEPSHVLKAMGIGAVIAQGSIRFSFGKDNTEEDIKYIIDILPPIIQKLRDMSPLYKS